MHQHITAAEETELLRSFAKSTTHAMLASDTDGNLVWSNPAAERMFGWTPDELVGRSLRVLLPPGQRDQVQALHHQLLEHGSLDTFVTRGQRRDGTTLDIQITPGVRYSERGQVIGGCALVRDVTDEIRALREHAASQERFRARFERSAKPQGSLDLSGHVVEVNDAACRLLGTTRSEAVGRHAAELVEADDPDDMAHQVRQLVAGQSEAAAWRAQAARPDGARVPVLVDVTLVRDQEGRAAELAVSVQDMSEVVEARREAASREHFFRALYGTSNEVAVVIGPDGALRYASTSLAQVYGHDPDTITDWGRELVHPDDRPVFQETLGAVLRESSRTARATLRLRDGAGTYRWFDARLTNLVHEPDIGGVVVNLLDVSAEMQAELALRDSEARHRAVVETAQEGILVLGPDGRVASANDKLTEILGLTVDQLRTEGVSALLPDEADPLTERAHLEQPYAHPDGSLRLLAISASPLSGDDGQPLGFLMMLSDVTAARQAEEELRRHALHDALTGLPNRLLLRDRLATAEARRERHPGQGIAVLYLDLDHFKLVNDSRGHEAGDQLLREVAGRLVGAVRGSDTVARLGGDEFAIVAEDTDLDGVAEVAERVQAALDQPFDVAGEPVYVSASLGLAVSPPHPVDDLLRLADVAMYDAKRAGRSQIRNAPVQRTQEARSQLAIGAALRRALENDEITLGYQSIVDLVTGRIRGFESLLRWSPGPASPATPLDVVRAADVAGLSFELDAAVVRIAVRDLAELRARKLVGESVAFSVNISAQSIGRSRLVAVVRDALRDGGLPAANLVLEITETALLEETDRAVRVLRRLRQSGVRIAVDDIGTGYNSLAQLQWLPVMSVKIDRLFIRDLLVRSEARAITGSIIDLAKAMGYGVVAEGVETEEQRVLLRDLGCDAGQGYLWGAARSLEELVRAGERAG